VTDATHDWRAGLRVTRSRSLSTDELEEIAQRRRRMRTTALAWLLGSPVIMVLGVVGILIALDPRESTLDATRVIVLALVFAFPIPIGFAIANEYRKRAGVLGRQAHDTTVLVCEGPRTDLLLTPIARMKLRGYLEDTPGVVLEVLSQSNLVWSINGEPLETWIIVPRGHTVEPPDRARLAARYVRPVETEHGTFRLHQRRLSIEECSELRGYLPRLRSPRVIFALCLNVFAAAHVIDYIRHPGGTPWDGIFVVTVVIWSDVQLARLARLWLKMSRDVREESVVIYQSNPAADASIETVTEFLPRSGMAWTIGGRPAPWRRLYAPSQSAS